MSERNIRRYDNSMFRAITTLLRGSLNDMLLAFSGRIPSSAIPRHVRRLTWRGMADDGILPLKASSISLRLPLKSVVIALNMELS